VRISGVRKSMKRVSFEPANCPHCQAKVALAKRSEPRWSTGAKVVLLAGCIVSGLLMFGAYPFAKIAAAALLKLCGYVPPRTGGTDDLQWLQAWVVLTFVVLFVAVLVALVPGYLCGRTAYRMPRHVRLECGAQCGWYGDGVMTFSRSAPVSGDKEEERPSPAVPPGNN
jgi:hypothetical protein